MSMTRAAVFAALFLFGPAVQAAQAQDVTLRSRDGSISVSGNFIGFDGEFYRVDTEFGVLTVDSSGVECEGPSCPDLTGFYPVVRIYGAEAVTKDLLPDLLTAFAADNGYEISKSDTQLDSPTILIDAATGGIAAELQLSSASNAAGFEALLAENADLFISTREATRDEKFAFLSAGVADLTDPLRARVLALDAVVPIVSPLNRLSSISLADLSAILSGGVTNWEEIGGQDAPISLYLDNDSLVSGSSVDTLVVKPRGIELSTEAVRVDTPIQGIAAVESDPYGIAFGRLSLGGNVKQLALTGECGFRAEGSEVDVKTEDYPMTQPLFLYSPALRLPKVARDFMAYVLSPSAQSDIARSAFVDQGIEALSFQDQGRRFANAIRNAGDEVTLEDLQNVTSTLYGARRLTLGFRFEDGSARLDAQSRSNVQLVAQLIEAGLFDGEGLTLAGFSDGQGAAVTNLSLSLRRAESVRTSILAALDENFDADQVTLRTVGFGETMPLACDDVDWGRGLNRRVELWVSEAQALKIP